MARPVPASSAVTLQCWYPFLQRQVWVSSALASTTASTAGQMPHLGVFPRTVSRKAIGVWPVRWWKYLLKWVALEKPRRSAIRAAL